MPLSADFDRAALLAVEGLFPIPVAKPARKRLAPFSIRLSEEDRARLAVEAAGAPLGAYIKSKVLGGIPEGRKRRKVLAIKDREALAQALALLGRADLANTLSQIAHAVDIGTYLATSETEAELVAALHAVREIRALVMAALGHREESA